MTLATTCPQCKTSFKVVPDQLKLRRGLVRCGKCQHVFSGIDYLSYINPRPQAQASGSVRPSAPTAPLQPPAANAPASTVRPAAEAPEPQPRLEDLNTAFFLPEGSEGEEASAPRPHPALRPSAAPSWKPAVDQGQPQDAAPAVPFRSNRSSSPSTPTTASSPGSTLAARPGTGHDPVATPVTHASAPVIPAPAMHAASAPVTHAPVTPAPVSAPVPAPATHAHASVTPAPTLAPVAVAEPVTALTAADTAVLPDGLAPSHAEATAQAAHDDAESRVRPSSGPHPDEAGHVPARVGRLARVAAIVIPALLALGLIAQAVAGWRNEIAASVPAIAPWLQGALKPFKLSVAPPRDRTALSIESFDLQATAVSNRLELSAVLRNQAGHEVAWPAMELSLTDSNGALMVRKVIAAPEYLGSASQASTGMAARSERPIRLLLDHQPPLPAGYSVDLFYP